MPTQFVDELLKALDNELFILRLSRRFDLQNAESLGVPTLDADPADSDWTSELLTGSEDSTMAIGKRELHPHPLAKLLKVSNKLLRSTSDGLSAETIVRDRLLFVFSTTLEKAFMTGSGAQQPLGVFTASSDGISTSRDVSTDNTTTAISADNLIEVAGTLKAQYRRNAQWIFHRDAITKIRKLKDGNGQYLWMPGLQAGQGDRILEMPYNVSEYAPNTFTSGKYVGILGDFRFFWVVFALDFAIQRLVELYAATNQVGFITRAEVDAAPVLEEAFVRVTLA